MEHQCENCGYFFEPGTNGPQVIQGCPNCNRPYRDQPTPTNSDMAIRDMPQPGMDDMGGNPLMEGILADTGWRPLNKRDESFASVRTTSDLSGLMWRNSDVDFPIEDAEVLAPDPKYTEAPHTATIHLKNGISDNLHQALLSTNAWVDNPYENGKLSPYQSNWESIRPKFVTGPMRIGVSDPYHAEIVNHVAQTDDLSPLQKMTNTKISGPAALALAPEALAGGGAAAAGGGGGLMGAAGIGGLMRGALGAGGMFRGAEGIGDMMGMGGQPAGTGGGGPSTGGVPIEDNNYYSSFGDDFDSPSSITKREDTDDPEDVDPHEKNDGDNKDWQKDFSVNDIGGTTTQSGFSPDSPGMQRLQMLLPLVLHYALSDDPGENDPLLAGLHQSLDSELPGYLDQGDDNIAHQLITALQGDSGHKSSHVVTSDHQGPQTSDQLAAVAQFLTEQGRGNEVPQMIQEPWKYAQELAQIQNKPDAPPEGGLNDNPPEPAIEQTDPNAGMPMPGMNGQQAQQMMSAVYKYGADAVADRCPKCDSGTTKILDEDGNSRCHNCGNVFKTESLVPQSVKGASYTSAMPTNNGSNPSHTWQDQNGQPLQPGRQYQVYSDKYEIPDIVTISGVKPNSIEWTLQGNHGLASGQEISHQEALLDGMTFVPFGTDTPDGSNVQGIETNDDTVNQTQPGFEQSDLSSPHMMTGSTTTSNISDGLISESNIVDEDVEHNDPALEWLNPRTAGAKFSPMEQKEFIEEAGVARNSDKLNLSGTHYESAIEDSFLFGW